jgi:hypothetical protein
MEAQVTDQGVFDVHGGHPLYVVLASAERVEALSAFGAFALRLARYRLALSAAAAH